MVQQPLHDSVLFAIHEHARGGHVEKGLQTIIIHIANLGPPVCQHSTAFLLP